MLRQKKKKIRNLITIDYKFALKKNFKSEYTKIMIFPFPLTDVTLFLWAEEEIIHIDTRVCVCNRKVCPKYRQWSLYRHQISNTTASLHLHLLHASHTAIQLGLFFFILHVRSKRRWIFVSNHLHFVAMMMKCTTKQTERRHKNFIFPNFRNY